MLGILGKAMGAVAKGAKAYGKAYAKRVGKNLTEGRKSASDKPEQTATSGSVAPPPETFKVGSIRRGMDEMLEQDEKRRKRYGQTR